MREILFRGKRKDNGEWVYGVPAIDDSRPEQAMICGHPAINIGVCGECGNPFIELHDVALSTIGQYTGLTDKNGKRIFEGDVIRGKGKRTFCVEYNLKIACFVACATDEDLTTPCMNYGTMLSYEVISTIHDKEAQHE